MDSESKYTAYCLMWNIDHLEFYDTDATAKLVEFPNYENTLAFSDIDEYQLPKFINFVADFRALSVNDFPYTNVQWSIFSRKALNVLDSVGQFPRREIPIYMVDDTFGVKDGEIRFDSNGMANPKAVNLEYVGVQLLEHLEIFDYEKSKFLKRSDFDPKIVRHVSEYVFETPKDGFPPIFRITADSVALFISGAARDAFKAAGIRGTAYQPLKMLEYTFEVDVPVPLPE